MSFHTSFYDEFKAQVYTRAEELHAQGLAEGTLEHEIFGELIVYIDRKPSMVLFSATGVEGPLAGKKVYVGGEEP
ncbi:MAG: hypothetical protein KDC03_23995 [Flavobacteriales bacterium]|nr:hypothetical protein [Flavobacteriales bacterium]